jgi:hypothetical protein
MANGDIERGKKTLQIGNDTLTKLPPDVRHTFLMRILYKELFPKALEKTIPLVASLLKRIYEEDAAVRDVESGLLAQTAQAIYAATYDLRNGSIDDQLAPRLEAQVPDETIEQFMHFSQAFKTLYLEYVRDVLNDTMKGDQRAKQEIFQSYQKEVEQWTDEGRRLVHQFMMDSLVNVVRMWAEESPEMTMIMERMPEGFWTKYKRDIHHHIKRPVGK